MIKINKAVIAVAGKGTRMNPITRALPKEMLPLGTVPILEKIIQEAVDSGITKIMLIINKHKSAIPAYFSNEKNPVDYNSSPIFYPYVGHDDVSIAYTYQEVPDGTGSAVLLAETFSNGEPFALMYGDDIIVSKVPCVKQLAACSEAHFGATVLGVQHLDAKFASLYASVECYDFDGTQGRISHINEKQKASEIKSDLTSLGRYILAADIFDYIRKTGKRNGEFWVTDAIELAAASSNCYAYNFEGKRYDTGNPKGYCEAFKALCGY